jgi:hypothetical protein
MLTECYQSLIYKINRVNTINPSKYVRFKKGLSLAIALRYERITTLQQKVQYVVVLLYLGNLCGRVDIMIAREFSSLTSIG